ncbi:WD40 repeat-like protein [Fomitiporia mediterranea MF3/22]|uniref:WD40 repeat-like protein n=1 Tax=Fomitiporia mediterranea (strain MF3/22) TaxID=694068 RepID=UPI000440881B|nr:WD40 repeat-like protein [Fomitiporia mediterranea MF3/22]EJC98429.1 WD40 repeat-like protein [Fomitiporia mediterranea MF3/22]
MISSVLLGRLTPEETNAFDRPQCLPGTRTAALSAILEWTLSDTDQNTFWLYGVAGSGKSTVSTTIAGHFRGIARLAAFLFFQRERSDPGAVIRTLAYKLASFDASLAKYIIEAIEEDNDIALAPAEIQFEKLLRDPLMAAKDDMKGLMVIVLDALDECGTEKTRRTLVETFRKGLPELPKNFRFLITSRKEPDIDQAFSLRPDRVCAFELEYDSESCRNDVLCYLDHALRKVFTIRTLPIPDDWQLKMSRLATAAAGLFIWASTAVKLVDCDNPAPKLTNLVYQSQRLSGLGKLYNSILISSGVSFEDESSKVRFAQVFGLILLSRIPLSDNTIDELLGFSSDEPSRLILSRLQSVLVFTRGAPVRFCHASFRDYLLSPERKSDPWLIDFESQKMFIASRCFEVLRGGLRFNICGLQSSYIPNDQIPGLPDRITANIPPHLEYACLFWTEHLRDAAFSPELLNELKGFLYNRLLYWLEVMCFQRKASPTLTHAMTWLSSHDADTLVFLKDARRIITQYLSLISEFTTHIYVSILPLESKDSRVMSHYWKQTFPLVQVDRRGIKQHSPLLKKLTGHVRDVKSVAFSSDGTRVASGSDDYTIRVWDAESGRVSSEPLEGHTDRVLSVAFSSDCARIVSGSADKTVRIWDVKSGQIVSGPLQGHLGWVWSVAFSPDGAHVVSGSRDNTIRIWDVESGRDVHEPLKGHTDTVRSVTFSPDGKHIASGSDDYTIIVWDIKTRRAISQPFEGHKGGVNSVSFSPCGKCIASGSDDETIVIWSIDSGKPTLEPFRGHSQRVWSVVFSSDGTRIVSGSNDRTIRIWDAETGCVVSEILEMHTPIIRSVAFSPDGTRVVSGSDDDMVRIWDSESEQAVSGQFEGHTDDVNSVTFSPDGRCIASGSSDNTIRIWDAVNGRPVSGPFEGHSSRVWSVVFSPDGRRIASCSSDRTIRIWDTESGQAISAPFEGHEDTVWSVSFSPDGESVVSGSDDKTLRIWDIESGRTVSGPFKEHTQSVNSVAFSPDGRCVASGSYDRTIILWDVGSGGIISGPLEKHTGWVCSVAFSPDGARIASGSGDKTIIIWDVKTGQPIAGPFEGHTNLVRSVAFSPDGALVVSGSEDSTLLVWDVESGRAIFAPFGNHMDLVRSVAVSPDGCRVVSGSRDRTIKVWNIESEKISSI